MTYNEMLMKAKKNQSFCNLTITEKNVKSLYSIAQIIFNNGRPNHFYTKDRVFSTMIAKANGTSLLWRKIHYVSFGHNGSQYISGSKLLAPGDPMPEYKMYQIVHYGLSKSRVENISPRF